MAKIIFKSNFGVHNYKKWNVETMTTFIIKTYLIPNAPKYKPSYEDSILKYFANPKLEGGNYLWDIKEAKEAKQETKLHEELEKQKRRKKVKVEPAIVTNEPMTGAGFNYLDAIAYPVNPIYNTHSHKIQSIIEPEDEFLVGGAFTDMAGMNCNKEDGSCFNPVWEKQKIKRQILSEYKIWYDPFHAPPAGTIRMAWLPKMIEERYKPLYDEFVARRNVNIGLPPDASKDRFAQQMFSNLTDGLSYVPVFNTVASLGLSGVSALTDTKKEDGS
jgi:hypothetical protein